MLAGVDQKHHKDHIYKRHSVDLLKTAALYGANGAGKSNLIKAIYVLKRIVVIGGRETLYEVKKYKLELEYSKLPTSFEVEFIKNDVVYLFGFKTNEGEILEEWLYRSGLNNAKDELIFHRTKIEGEIEIDFSKNYSLTEKDVYNLEFVKNNLVNSNELLIHILSELKEGFSEIKKAFEWFQINLIAIFPSTKPGASLILALIKSQELMDFTNSSMCSFKTGITSANIKSFSYMDLVARSKVSYEKIKQDLDKVNEVALVADDGSESIIATLENDEVIVKRFVGEHKDSRGNPVEFFLSEESDGTNRLLELIPAFFQLLNSESVVLIDEIDQSIHPVLLKELVKKFVSDQKTQGQFIFTTHEANLLDQSIFRRDEIWFVEKDQGETKLYPLSDFDIRYDLDIRRGYLNGRFGAIPFMGDLQNLNWDQYAEAE
ncbi:transporter [Persicitalea jodogahamensis]|uniref:Transporter n=2 Tax=Persicitalea jodogahamensis TaxID=402147 RepID=A0A8J3G8N9_9BACT|nr:transporter [Persicitalea jodogahamensis]